MDMVSEDGARLIMTNDLLTALPQFCLGRVRMSDGDEYSGRRGVMVIGMVVMMMSDGDAVAIDSRVDW